MITNNYIKCVIKLIIIYNLINSLILLLYTYSYIFIDVITLFVDVSN